MNKPRILFWHRKDLRIYDNQALIKAFSLSNAITATYIIDKNYSHDFNANSRAWFLGNSLQELRNNWGKMGSRLVIEEGDPVLIIPELAKTIDAKFVVWNKSIEPYEIHRDLQIKNNLNEIKKLVSYYQIKDNEKNNIIKSYIIGKNIIFFKKQLQNKVQFSVKKNLKNAIISALKDIKLFKKINNTILLSPGAASFDQFKNFENRGNEFKKLSILYAKKFI